MHIHIYNKNHKTREQATTQRTKRLTKKRIKKTSGDIPKPT